MSTTTTFFSDRNLFRQKALQQSCLTCLQGFHSNSYRLTRAIQRYNTCKIPFSCTLYRKSFFFFFLRSIFYIFFFFIHVRSTIYIRLPYYTDRYGFKHFQVKYTYRFKNIKILSFSLL